MAQSVTETVEDGKLFIKRTEDVEPLLDHLKEQRNHGDQNQHLKNAARWRKAGEVPMSIIHTWMTENPPFNALAPGAGPEVLRRLKRDYPYLLAVNKI